MGPKSVFRSDIRCTGTRECLDSSAEPDLPGFPTFVLLRRAGGDSAKGGSGAGNEGGAEGDSGASEGDGAEGDSGAGSGSSNGDPIGRPEIPVDQAVAHAVGLALTTAEQKQYLSYLLVFFRPKISADQTFLYSGSRNGLDDITKEYAETRNMVFYPTITKDLTVEPEEFVGVNRLAVDDYESAAVALAYLGR